MMSGKGKPSQKKGILKLKELSKGGSKISKVEVPEVPSTKEMVVTYPIIKTSDKEHLLPRFSAILRRTEEDGVGMDDLDSLQVELETMLSAAAVRTRVLQDEIQALNSSEDKQDTRGKLSPLAPGKRVRFQDRVVVKKFKEMPGKAVREANQSPSSSKFMKMKSFNFAATNSGISETDDLSRKRAPRGKTKDDTPNKFWTFVEPYCSDVTPEDVKLLEALIEENEDDPDYYEIPPLGHHYSLRWAEEDNIDEGNESPSLSAKKADKSNEGVTAGPLTQRLLSALMEENFAPVELMCKGNENRTPQLFKNFSVSNSSSFERRVRKELEEQGILDMEEMSQEEDSDEILQELQRCQEELKCVSSYNVQHLKRLLKQANDELVRQDLKKRLQQTDAEVIDLHGKMLAARQNEEVFPEKEQEACWKALEERDKLLRHIDSL